MTPPVISVRGLGKKYRLGETIRHDTLRDKIAHSLKTLFAKKENSEAHPNLPSDPQSAIPNCPPLCPSPSALRPPELPSAPPSALRAPESSPVPRSALRAPHSADFWALKDVSFDVQQGEVLGIIGRNGAGKSTLLKILSQITEPTEGEIHMRGRVASLLEVGTGFHPELTGRENIFLNGAILGMARSEIRKKFDEIVAFAEVEQFIDTPVKRYSSGMYVRLAFAVAAHLDSEILIIDEVLAVGDTQFQNKCTNKMGNVAQDGRTILFVSHNMGLVRRLCGKAILLDHGILSAQGNSDDMVQLYLSNKMLFLNAEANLENHPNRSGMGKARFQRVRVLDSHGAQSIIFAIHSDISLEMEVEYLDEKKAYSHCVVIYTSEGIPVYHIWDIDFRKAAPPPCKRRTLTVIIKDVSLYPDNYYVWLWVGDPTGQHTEDYVRNAVTFIVEQIDPSFHRGLSKDHALVYKSADWQYQDVKQ